MTPSIPPTNHNFPPAFAARMEPQLGDAWADFVAAHQQPAPVSVRFHPDKSCALQTDARVPWTSQGYYLPTRPVFTLDPAFHAGAYYVQEASSMFLEQAFPLFPNDTNLRVLDLCAAPGGKSTHLSGYLRGRGLLVSNEVIRSRAGILAENLQKWGYANSVVTNNDPEDFAVLEGFFDVMVVDAPCSGEGLFRKDPEAMQEWSEENVSLCSKRQRRILADIWPALREGGLLIYSTCTYNREENEENLRWLKQEKNLAYVSLPLDPSWHVTPVDEDGLHGYHFYPHRNRGEGFFMTVLRKLETTDTIAIKNNKSAFAPPAKKITEQISPWIQAEAPAFIQRDDVVQYIPAERLADVSLLSRHLRLVSAGVFVASVKHDKLIPEHALALSVAIQSDAFAAIEVSYDEALQYLRKETLAPRDITKGFALIRYEGLNLGWVNALPNRLNNLYPQAWRIRLA